MNIVLPQHVNRRGDQCWVPGRKPGSSAVVTGTPNAEPFIKSELTKVQYRTTVTRDWTRRGEVEGRRTT